MHDRSNWNFVEERWEMKEELDAPDTDLGC